MRGGLGMDREGGMGSHIPRRDDGSGYVVQLKRPGVPGPSSGKRRRGHLRLSWTLVLVIAAFMLLAARLSQLQGLESTHLARMAKGELLEKVTVPAMRGNIYDRSMRPLAVTVMAEKVVADDFQIHHPEKEASELAPMLHLSEATLVGLLDQRNGYVVLATGISDSEAKEIAAKAFPGIVTLPDELREYPEGTLAESALGAVNPEDQGISGIEEAQQKLLAGLPGEEIEEVAPNGAVLPGSKRVLRKARQGTSLVLTIDAPMEALLRRDLEKEVVASHAVNGTAIVMDPRTGSILAMVNVVAGLNHTAGPTTDNYAVTRAYEPGSVFKIVTFSTALQDGVITPTTELLVPDHKRIGGWEFHDAWSHSTHDMTATHIIAKSSNIGTIMIAHMLGKSRLAAAVRNFGFGKPTSLDFPGQSAGIVQPSSTWSASAMGSLPIGQTDAVTAIQMLDAMNAIADGGIMMPPHLVKATIGPSGKEVPVRLPAGRRIVTAKAAHELAGMLQRVTWYGTAMKAAIPGYEVSGKTGTSNIPKATGGYYANKYYATFAGFVPSNDPRLSAIIILKAATPPYGGSVCAPVFARVMSWALARLRIPPNGMPERTKSGDVASKGWRGAVTVPMPRPSLTTFDNAA
jgi:cell division protein FtsI (penicillin-binding protein 3)